MSSEATSPCAGWVFSNRILASNFAPQSSPRWLELCAILMPWRWSSPLTARSADDSYRTFAGGFRRDRSRKLYPQLSRKLFLDRDRRRCRSQRPLLPQDSHRPQFLIRVPLRHAADQHHRQPRPRILSRLLDRTRAARPALALAGRHWLLRLIHNFLQLRLRKLRAHGAGTMAPDRHQHRGQQRALPRRGPRWRRPCPGVVKWQPALRCRSRLWLVSSSTICAQKVFGRHYRPIFVNKKNLAKKSMFYHV